MDARDQNGMTETEFLRQYDPDRYEKPAVTVDMLIFTVNPERDYSLELLMIERGGHPYLGTWALPGGFVEMNESLEEAAARELKEETGAEPETFLPLGKLLPAPGCYGETLHLFLAKGLKFSQQQLDPDEFLNVERVPFDEMVHRCVNGEIDDAKTVAAVLRAKVLLNL